MDKAEYGKLLQDSTTSTYKKADEKIYCTISEEGEIIATKLNIEGRMECMAKQQASIS